MYAVFRLAKHLDSILFPQEICISELDCCAPTVSQDCAPCVAGAACLLPQSTSLAKFWSLLSRGDDPICTVPDSRWDESEWMQANEVAGNKCYVQCGGFVTGLELFDAAFFHISSAEAKQMDPHQCSVLEVC